jgi:hypothetical protein
MTPKSVDELREHWEQRTVKHQASVQIMLAGFQTEFWGILRREMETRRDSLKKSKLGLLDSLGLQLPTVEQLYLLNRISSELQVYNILLGLEDALRLELDKIKSVKKLVEPPK